MTGICDFCHKLRELLFYWEFRVCEECRDEARRDEKINLEDDVAKDDRIFKNL